MRPALIAALLATALSALGGESRTLTAKDGRSIEAEILGYKGDRIRVRRADTRREFTLSLASLAEETRISLREFFQSHPELRDTAQASDLRVESSRIKFDRSISSDTDWRDESMEKWGFLIQVSNRTSLPLEELRVEYILFSRLDPDDYHRTAKANARAPLERTSGRQTLDAIAPGGRVEIRTDPVSITRVNYENDYYTVNNNGRRLTSWRDREIHGLWYRIYDGDKLVLEGGTPDALRKSETWDAPPSP